jgi:hypothetical protein
MIKCAEPFQIQVRVSKIIFRFEAMNNPGKSIFGDTPTSKYCNEITLPDSSTKETYA